MSSASPEAEAAGLAARSGRVRPRRAPRRPRSAGRLRRRGPPSRRRPSSWPRSARRRSTSRLARSPTPRRCPLPDAPGLAARQAAGRAIAPRGRHDRHHRGGRSTAATSGRSTDRRAALSPAASQRTQQCTAQHLDGLHRVRLVGLSERESILRSTSAGVKISRLARRTLLREQLGQCVVDELRIGGIYATAGEVAPHPRNHP